MVPKWEKGIVMTDSQWLNCAFEPVDYFNRQSAASKYRNDFAGSAAWFLDCIRHQRLAGMREDA